MIYSSTNGEGNNNSNNKSIIFVVGGAFTISTVISR